MKFVYWFLQPVEQFVTMGTRREGLPGKEQGAMPEVTGLNGFLLSECIIFAQEQHPLVADWQGQFLIFGRVKPAIDKGKVDKAAL